MVKVKAVAHSYWRRIKDGARIFVMIPFSVQDDVRTLARAEVEAGTLSVEQYAALLGEDFPGEVI